MNTTLWVTRTTIASALAAGALAASACTVQTTTAPPPMGQLIVDWTLDGSTDPNLCAQSSSASLHVHVVDQTNGIAVGDFSFDCTAGVGTIELDQGTYEAQAWLEDSSGMNRTTQDAIPTFVITSVATSVSIDFPSNSFE